MLRNNTDRNPNIIEYKSNEKEVAEIIEHEMEFFEFNQQSIIDELRDLHKKDPKSWNELNNFVLKFDGLCELISNYVIMQDLLGDKSSKKKHPDEKLIENNKIDHYKMIRHDDSIELRKKNHKDVLKRTIVINELNEPQIKNSHILNVSNFFKKMIAIAFKIYPHNLFSIRENYQLADGNVNKELLKLKLESLPDNSYIKYEVFKKGKAGLSGHSMVIKKTGKFYSFFDPSKGEHRWLTFQALCEHINHSHDGASMVFLNGNDYINSLGYQVARKSDSDWDFIDSLNQCPEDKRLEIVITNKDKIKWNNMKIKQTFELLNEKDKFKFIDHFQNDITNSNFVFWYLKENEIKLTPDERLNLIEKHGNKVNHIEIIFDLTIQLPINKRFNFIKQHYNDIGNFDTFYKIVALLPKNDQNTLVMENINSLYEDFSTQGYPFYASLGDYNLPLRIAQQLITEAKQELIKAETNSFINVFTSSQNQLKEFIQKLSTKLDVLTRKDYSQNMSSKTIKEDLLNLLITSEPDPEKLSAIMKTDTMKKISWFFNGVSPFDILKIDNIKKLKASLEAKVDVNKPDELGNTPLHQAVTGRFPEPIKILLESKANVDQKNKNDDTPLHLAIKRKNLDAIKLLLDAKADVNIKGENGCTALHWAVLGRRDLEAIKLLLEAKANVDIKNEFGMAPLHLAVENGNLEIVKVLLSAKIDVNIRGLLPRSSSPLHLAVDSRNLDIINVLLKAKADVNLNSIDGTPLLMAAERGYLDVFKVLLNAKADVNLKNENGRNILINFIINLGSNEKRGEELSELLLKQSSLSLDKKDSESFISYILSSKNNTLISALFNRLLSAESKLFEPKLPSLVKAKLTDAFINFVTQLPDDAEKLNQISKVLKENNYLHDELKAQQTTTRMFQEENFLMKIENAFSASKQHIQSLDKKN